MSKHKSSDGNSGLAAAIGIALAAIVFFGGHALGWW